MSGTHEYALAVKSRLSVIENTGELLKFLDDRTKQFRPDIARLSLLCHRDMGNSILCTFDVSANSTAIASAVGGHAMGAKKVHIVIDPINAQFQCDMRQNGQLRTTFCDKCGCLPGQTMQQWRVQTIFSPNKIITTPHLSVGDVVLDQQHQELLALCERVADCVDDTNPGRTEHIDDILYELSCYAGAHFRTEEEVLTKLNYPRLEEHRMEHFEYLKRLQEVVDAASRGVIDKASLRKLLTEWFTQHVLESDMQYKHFIQPH